MDEERPTGAPTGASTVARGDRVAHPELGPGEVARTRRGGRALLVRFDSQPKLLLEVKAHEVVATEAETETETETGAVSVAVSGTGTGAETEAAGEDGRLFRRHPEEVPEDLAENRGAAQTVEALRLGVVPHADLRASSVGRETELALVGADLEETERSGAARVFLGDYGTGKTHLLELIEHEALSHGFLVGRATLDAQYVQPNHPQRVYRSLVSSLRYPSDQGQAAVGLAPLFEQAATDAAFTAERESGASPLAGHLYLSAALHYYAELREHEDPLPRDLLLDWISGQRPEGNQELDAVLRTLGTRGPRVYALKDFQPWAHVYGHLLGGLGVLARRLGYRGLVLLLDEAENYDLLGNAARSFADSLFRCLVLAALGEERVRFGPETVEKGGFGPQKRLPLRFQPEQHLYFVSAMTPSTAGEKLLRGLVGGERLNELTTLSLDDYHELGRRITAVFEHAHPEMALPGRIARPIAEVLWALIRSENITNPREASKLTVELLDLIRLQPERLATFFDDIERAMALG